jgi:hypothetical protein
VPPRLSASLPSLARGPTIGQALNTQVRRHRAPSASSRMTLLRSSLLLGRRVIRSSGAILWHYGQGGEQRAGGRPILDWKGHGLRRHQREQRADSEEHDAGGAFLRMKSRWSTGGDLAKMERP